MSEPTVLQRVLAGPGSGKTTLLTDELRQRLQAGAPSKTLLGVTFTRRAAREMQQRLLRAYTASPPWLGTFHQLARRILADLHRLPQPLVLDSLIPTATAALRQGSIPPWTRLLRFIAVDEAQDLDQTQVDFLNALRPHTDSAELLLVGDPDQAIFSFRQASPRFLLQPEAHFHQPCRTICLTKNHRSARAIVDAARALLSPTADPQAPCHRLFAARTEAHPALRHISAESPEAEAVRIFEEVRTLLALGIPPTEIAILVRLRNQLPPLQAEACRWHLPVYLPPLRDQLESSADPPVPPENAVTLSTLHQAKGLEWTVVFIAGCQASILPSPLARTEEARREELRLLYVGTTRARQLLFFSRYSDPSPFLSALNPQPPQAAPSPAGPSWLRWFLDRFCGHNGHNGASAPPQISTAESAD